MNQQRRTSVRRDRVTKTPHKQGLQTTDEDVAKKEGAGWNQEIRYRLD